MSKAEKAKKKIASSKVEKQIHPKSRKASQLAKSIHKGEKKQQRKDDFESKQLILKEKLMWFKEEIIGSEKEKYSLTEVSRIISRYLNRFGERLKEINDQNEFNKSRGRHGRYHASEEEAIKMVNESETDLFTKGHFEAPDLTNTSNVKTLRTWDGELKALSNIKLRKFRKETVEDSKTIQTEMMES